MYVAAASDTSRFMLLLVLLAWIFTLAAVVAVVLFVARWALAKAESKDVPQVLTGLTQLLRAASWTKDLTSLMAAAAPGTAIPTHPAEIEGAPTDNCPPVGAAADHNDDDVAAGGGR